MKWSLLVLPFDNISGAEEDDYLADGLTEELISALTIYEELSVASRTSSFYFKEKSFSLEEIAQKLTISHVLEGSLRRQGAFLRIVVHLTDVRNGYTLWSETFTFPATDILEVQQTITQRITHKITPASTARVPLQQVPNNDNEAYRFYLKGMYFFHKYSMDNIAKAIEWFRKATQLQPNFAQSYAAMSTCYLALGGYIRPAYYKDAKDIALKAIQIDDQLMEPHLSLAFVQMYYDWDWEGAERSISKAFDINIRSAFAHRVKGVYYRTIGQLQNAIHAHEVATKYDPVNVIFINGLALLLAQAGRYEAAMEEYQKCLDLDANFRPAVEGMAWIKTYQEKWDDAIKLFLKYQEMTGHPLKGWYGVGYVYGQMGRPDLAQEILAKLDQRQAAKPDETLDFDYAVVYLGMSRKEEAFYYLNKAISKYHLISIYSLQTDPIFKGLKKDIRYRQLLHTLKLAVEPSEDSRNNIKVLKIKGDTNESLLIDSNQLFYLKSDGNYTRFFWLEGQQIRERLLRIPLSRASEQIDAPFFLQTHRSYFVNLIHFTQLVKTGRTYMLENKKFDIRIPVARSRSQLILQKSDDLFRRK